MLLAIDTATQMVSVALHDGRQILAERTWHSPNQHTRQMAVAIRSMLVDAGIAIQTLDAVAVASGPGSYTGLRVGMALAKGIAGANNLPLIGVSTFDIVAAAAPQTTGALIVTLLAGRTRISVARYQFRKGQWKARGEAENMTWEELIASIDGAATITGEIDDAGWGQIEIAQNANASITVMPGAVRLRRAGMLAELAIARLRDEDFDIFKPESVVPIYIKTKDSPA